MDTALDDIAFLANSDNRVAVFERLVDGSRARDELTDQVDASRQPPSGTAWSGRTREGASPVFAYLQTSGHAENQSPIDG